MQKEHQIIQGPEAKGESLCVGTTHQGDKDRTFQRNRQELHQSGRERAVHIKDQWMWFSHVPRHSNWDYAKAHGYSKSYPASLQLTVRPDQPRGWFQDQPWLSHTSLDLLYNRWNMRLPFRGEGFGMVEAPHFLSYITDDNNRIVVIACTERLSKNKTTKIQ